MAHLHQPPIARHTPSELERRVERVSAHGHEGRLVAQHQAQRRVHVDNEGDEGGCRHGLEAAREEVQGAGEVYDLSRAWGYGSRPGGRRRASASAAHDAAVAAMAAITATAVAAATDASDAAEAHDAADASVEPINAEQPPQRPADPPEAPLRTLAPRGLGHIKRRRRRSPEQREAPGEVELQSPHERVGVLERMQGGKGAGLHGRAVSAHDFLARHSQQHAGCLHHPAQAGLQVRCASLHEPLEEALAVVRLADRLELDAVVVLEKQHHGELCRWTHIHTNTRMEK